MLSTEKKPALRTGPGHSPQGLDNAASPQAGAHTWITRSPSAQRGGRLSRIHPHRDSGVAGPLFSRWPHLGTRFRRHEAEAEA